MKPVPFKVATCQESPGIAFGRVANSSAVHFLPCLFPKNREILHCPHSMAQQFNFCLCCRHEAGLETKDFAEHP